MRMCAVNHPFKSNLYIIYFFLTFVLLWYTSVYVYNMILGSFHLTHNTAYTENITQAHFTTHSPTNSTHNQQLLLFLLSFTHTHADVQAIGYAPRPTIFIDDNRNAFYIILFKEVATTTPFFHLLSWLTTRNAIKKNYSNEMWRV